MSMKGLGRAKPPTDEEREAQRLAFIAGASLQAGIPEDSPQVEGVKPAPKARKPKKEGAKRTIFSLTDTVNTQIDKLSLAPRAFKATRSDVVKAGVIALRAMSKAEVVALLAQVTGSDSVEDQDDDE